MFTVRGLPVSALGGNNEDSNSPRSTLIACAEIESIERPVTGDQTCYL